MKKFIYLIPLLVAITIAFTAFNQKPEPTLSPETETCLGCHETISPGIVADWRRSLHFSTTPSIAMKKGKLERKMSAQKVNESLANVVVGCYECHSQNADSHKDNFEHFGYRINVVVSINDCRTCHTDEAEEYSHSKKAYALDILRENPLYSLLVETLTSDVRPDGDKTKIFETFEHAKGESCYACHGTEVTVSGMETVNSEMGEAEVPRLTNWPNQGVGRINPDGSKGACTSCHPRHSFSIETARQPYTCGQCHLEPDVPAYNVYMESKHGNVFESKKSEFNLKNAALKLGEDFQTPTCSVCHNSLVVSPSGDVISERTHNFGDRLWVRIFGLPYSHPQPKTGKTFEIRNADGQPLPTTFLQIPASEFLIDATESKTRKDNMGKLCKNCHSTGWTNSFFAKIDTTNKQTDRLVRTATDILLSAYKQKKADPSNPFDEVIEHDWVNQWLFYANSVRYATAMSGPDYAGFKNGWYYLTNNIRKMQKNLESTKKK